MPFCFTDFETQSNADLSVTGTLKYVLDPSTRPLLNSWAIDNGPVQLWCPDLSVELAPEVWFYVRGRMAVVGTPPPDIVRVLSKPDGYLVAHNMAFDRAVWQQIATPDYGWPRIEIEQTLCSMAQSQASNLPGQLDWAGRMLGLGQKTIGGKAIMLRFAQRQQPLPGARVLIDAAPDRLAALKAAIEMWTLYLDYSVQDTELMRAVWQTTRPLDATEWREYWVSEKINDRGMLADLDVCRGAVAYREEEALHVEAECKRLTDGAIAAPTLTKQINEWLFERLPDDLAETMVKARDEETNAVTRLTGAKDVMGRLLEDIQVTDAPPEDSVVEFLELLQFGRSSSAVKFEKILNQEVDGRLGGSYVFNGAGQTGRFCVAPDTLIDTPAGVRKIVDLAVGDFVTSHRQRPRMVTAKTYKGVEQMFRLEGSYGEFVVATSAHRVLTEKGWLRLDECFELALGGPCILRRGCAPLSYAGVHNRADRREAWNHTRHGERSATRGHIGRRILAPAWGESFPEENRRIQSDVREEDGGRTHTTERASGGLERRRVHLRTPDNCSEVVGAGGATYSLGGASYRRGQDEQRFGQLSNSYQGRSSTLTQGSTWTLVQMGAGEVWDISVAGDESYVAQGIAHHNSSRGVQVHNLPRDYLKNELDVLDMVAAKVPIEQLRKIGPVSSVLAKLIRPTFIAPAGKLFVWGDWSAIEARVTPWLANTRDAEQAVLEPFRQSDIDDAKPDVYVLNAAQVFHTDPAVLWERYKNGDPEAKAMRQGGKVMVLSLGFRGSVGALKAMARNYGIRITNEEAKTWVDGWRDRNRWNKRFGVKVEEAAFAAIDRPMSLQKAGRLTYQYAPDLMGGTLVCFLPDGRPIIYPIAKISKVEKFGKEQDAITYLNGMGRRSLWDGLQIENGTQATAASILRQTLVRIEDNNPPAAMLVGHTHDEVIGEVDEDHVEGFASYLESAMVEGFDWTAGLPLAAEVSTSWFYTKSA